MGRTRGFLWLLAGLVVAALAAIVAFIIISRPASEQPEAGQPGLVGRLVPVVVTVRPVPVGTQLTAEDVEVRQVPVETAPEGAVGVEEDAVGKLTTVDLYAGETILAQRLADPSVVSGDGRLALVLAEDEVLMAYPAADLMSQVGVLKPGDHVDLLFSLDFPTERIPGAQGGAEDEQATFNLLQNLTIAAIVGGQTTTGGQATAPEAILFTIDPQDALTLKYVKDAGGILDIVLRAPQAEQPFEVDPVDLDYLLNRYQIPAAVGQ